MGLSDFKSVLSGELSLEPDESKDLRVAVLDPRKVSDFSDLENLQGVEIEEKDLRFEDIKLVYDNWKASEVLRAIIPPEIDAVASYSIIGHILHLNLRENLSEFKQIIGQVFLDKIPNIRTVVNKTDNIDNTYRNFQMELLCGDDDMVATIRENKCTFKLDFSTVYWNPRLCTEHERIVNKLSKGDVLYDVFAGIGPFSVPAAHKGVKVLANDLNPESCKWLRENAQSNKVGSNIDIFNKDGADFIREDLKAHLLTLRHSKDYKIHITMNLPALAYSFLKTFRGLLSQDELQVLGHIPVPSIYLYCFAKGVQDPKEIAKELVENELGPLGDLISEIAFVRNVAPNKEMMRVTIQLTEEILGSLKRPSSLEESDGAKRPCLE
jgi:tRNA (guanine37-N1)-methyltransferase